MKSTLRHVFTVGGFTAFSRVLGLVREMLQARLIGAGVEQSAFTLAFAIPNMARKLFGEGALTAAFVPIFKREAEERGLAEAAKLARAVVTMMLLMLGSLLVVALAGLWLWAVKLQIFSPGGSAYRLRMTFSLVVVLLPYMLAICGAAFGMGVLNALGRFKASSFMPTLLNLIWIGALVVLLFFPHVTPARRVLLVASAILAGGFLQMFFMFYRMSKVGVRPWPLFHGWRAENVKRVWRNTAIAAFGAGAVQINYMLDQVLAQCAAPWAAGVIGYAERLMDLPLGVVGVAFGTVLLPTFSGLFAKGDIVGAKKALRTSASNLLLVMLPAAAGLFLLAPEITSVIYQGKAFDATATVRVSRALAVYALGLGFFGVQKSLVPWFQAQSDMKTPLRISVQMVALNAVLNVLAVVFLPVEWRHVGLACSTVVCAGIGCFWLAVAAHRKNGSMGFRGIVRQWLGIAGATGLLAATIVAVRLILPAWGAFAFLVVAIVSGAVVYGLACRLLFGRRLGFQ